MRGASSKNMRLIRFAKHVKMLIVKFVYDKQNESKKGNESSRGRLQTRSLFFNIEAQRTKLKEFIIYGCK